MAQLAYALQVDDLRLELGVKLLQPGVRRSNGLKAESREREREKRAG